METSDIEMILRIGSLSPLLEPALTGSVSYVFTLGSPNAVLQFASSLSTAGAATLLHIAIAHPQIVRGAIHILPSGIPYFLEIRC
jgi:hypothetical protein